MEYLFLNSLGEFPVSNINRSKSGIAIAYFIFWNQPSLNCFCNSYSCYSRVKHVSDINFRPCIRRFENRSCREIQSHNKSREVDYNVVLFDDINDSKEDALKIYSLLSSYRLIPLSTVKINKYNHVDGSSLKPSQRQPEFVEYLRYLNVNVETYETNGVDIGAACGQLVNG